jgi:hypothetical protein
MQLQVACRAAGPAAPPGHCPQCAAGDLVVSRPGRTGPPGRAGPAKRPARTQMRCQPERGVSIASGYSDLWQPSPAWIPLLEAANTQFVPVLPGFRPCQRRFGPMVGFGQTDSNWGGVGGWGVEGLRLWTGRLGLPVAPSRATRKGTRNAIP